MRSIKMILLLSALLLMQSCCVYHMTTNTPKGKVSEIGIAPYHKSPISKITEEKKDGS